MSKIRFEFVANPTFCSDVQIFAAKTLRGAAPDHEKIVHDWRKYQHLAVPEIYSGFLKDNINIDCT